MTAEQTVAGFVVLVLICFVVYLLVIYDPPKKPFVFVPGKEKSSPTLYGRCDECGCVFSARKKDCQPNYLGSPWLHHECPTKGCLFKVLMSEDSSIVPPLTPPRRGSGLAPPKPKE